MAVFLIADKETESQRLIKSPKVTQTDFVSGISKLKAHEFCFFSSSFLFYYGKNTTRDHSSIHF